MLVYKAPSISQSVWQ